jgi:hypothetical protein
MTELSIMIIGVGSREMAPIPTFSLFGTGGTERQSGPFVFGRNVLSFHWRIHYCSPSATYQPNFEEPRVESRPRYRQVAAKSVSSVSHHVVL